MKQSNLVAGAIVVAVLIVAVVASQFIGRSGPGQSLPSSSPGASASGPTGSPGPSGSTPSSAASHKPGRTPKPGSATPSPNASGVPPSTEPGSPPPETPMPTAAADRFPGGLLIADRLNGRLLVVDDGGNILWRFPEAGSLPAGETFSADDAFISPDHKTIVANEEENQVIVRIDIATKKVIWEYGQFGHPGGGPGQLWNPDDAYPLANGDITVADIKNCRIIEISPAKKIVKQWGSGVCSDNPPHSYGQPNGDTPLPDGGMLITEIYGARVVRLSATGKVLFDIHVPLHYPSDAQLLPDGNVLVVDYWSPGSLIVVNPQTGQVVYRWAPKHGPGRLNHPSLALPLPDGTFVLNDDYRHRVVVIDPAADNIVWTYGHTGQSGKADGFLNNPDGVDIVPVGIFK
jgi:outer membrane protein assembly factor BamB